jgi:hypothetical protein
MKVIAISGVARAGKDTFADTLANILRENHPNLKIARESFAEPLKLEMSQFILEKFDKDIFKLEGKDKDLIRPLLVAYGQAKRMQTQGRYWLDLLIKKTTLSNPDVVIVSDLRFKEELDWLKHVNGKLVHIKRFDLKNGKKVFVKPANSDEKENDPILNNAADFKAEWLTALPDNDLEESAKKVCLDFYYKNINMFL